MCDLIQRGGVKRKHGEEVGVFLLIVNGGVCVYLYLVFLSSSSFLPSPFLSLPSFLCPFSHIHCIHPQTQIAPSPQGKEVISSSLTEIPQWWEGGNQSI